MWASRRSLRFWRRSPHTQVVRLGFQPGVARSVSLSRAQSGGRRIPVSASARPCGRLPALCHSQPTGPAAAVPEGKGTATCHGPQLKSRPIFPSLGSLARTSTEMTGATAPTGAQRRGERAQPSRPHSTGRAPSRSLV